MILNWTEREEQEREKWEKKRGRTDTNFPPFNIGEQKSERKKEERREVKFSSL